MCSRRNCTPTFISSTASSALRPRSGAVDAWDADLPVPDYPVDIDVSGTGFVYYLYQDMASEWGKLDPVDEADYLAWLESYVGDATSLEIAYLPLTEETILQMQQA